MIGTHNSDLGWENGRPLSTLARFEVGVDAVHPDFFQIDFKNPKDYARFMKMWGLEAGVGVPLRNPNAGDIYPRMLNEIKGWMKSSIEHEKDNVTAKWKRIFPGL